MRWTARVIVLASLAGVLAVGVWAEGTGMFPAFTPLPGYVAEGVAVDKVGQVYVSLRDGDQGRVWRFSPSGEPAFFATLGTGEAGGLAVTANGDVYATMASGPDRGVYRIEANGYAERLPGTEEIAWANALAFDHKGTLYITESYSKPLPTTYGPGGIWRVRRDEPAELWLRHALLTGIGIIGYPIGANGIAYDKSALLVVNTDKGLILRVPILQDGSAGQPELWAALQEVDGVPPGNPMPAMGDGLALDVHGNAYVAVVSRNAVVRIRESDRLQETVALLAPTGGRYPMASLDTPASLAFGTGKGERTSLFVTNLGWMSQMAPGRPWPGAGLVKIDAGVPGRPLP
ncbi:MAG: SMP-30/gluconolactonase/LRE family protein [Vicinamibacterales bacterium]